MLEAMGYETARRTRALVEGGNILEPLDETSEYRRLDDLGRIEKENACLRDENERLRDAHAALVVEVERLSNPRS